MAKQNRICHTCGNGYYYCPSCQKDRRDPQIYIMWCSERCKKIFGLLSDETFNKITTAECKDELIKLGVTLDDAFRGGVQTHAKRVLSYVEPVVETEIVINEIPVFSLAEESVGIETEISATASVSKNKKKRKK